MDGKFGGDGHGEKNHPRLDTAFLENAIKFSWSLVGGSEIRSFPSLRKVAQRCIGLSMRSRKESGRQN
jgi:hypothetical protein